jgi:hypothetical protein
MAATEKKNMQLPGIPKKMGRPVTGNAKSNAERQAEHRTKLAREKAAVIENTALAHSSTSDSELLLLFPEAGPVVLQSIWCELGRRRGWLV